MGKSRLGRLPYLGNLSNKQKTLDLDAFDELLFVANSKSLDRHIVAVFRGYNGNGSLDMHLILCNGLKASIFLWPRCRESYH